MSETSKEIEVEAVEVSSAEEINRASLITVKQIPIIEERLKDIKGIIQDEVDHALSLECTDENKQQIKKLRSNLSKQFKLLEADRKKIKNIVLGPYEAFEATYKECVTNIFKPADNQLKDRIAAIENAEKEAKREKAIVFFNEYAAAHNINFVSFDDVGVEVTLSVSEKKLKDTCKAFIDKVVGDLALIDTQEHKADILVEYKKSLNVSRSITSVKLRYQAIEEEKRRIAEAEARKKAEAEHRQAVEQAIEKQKASEETPIAAPKAVEVPTAKTLVEEAPKEKLYNVRFAFQLYGVSKEKAIEAKKYFEDYLKKEGIDYAITK